MEIIILVTCVLVSAGVSAVDVVGLVDWDGVDRSMVDWSRDGESRDMVNRGLVDRGMVDRGGVGRGMVDRGVVDRGGVGSLVVMVGTRVLWGGGAGLVRPRVVWEPGGVGQVLQVAPSKQLEFTI